MAKFGRKGTWKKILAGALAVVLGVGAIAGVSALIGNKADDDGKIVINPKWSIGGLDNQGKYEESDATLYTKDAFECQGLTIKPNFDSNVKYQIFFYDELGEFVESSSLLESSYDSSIPVGATHARLELTPIWDEDVKEKDRVIKWYNKHQWTNNLEIKVNEEQNGVEKISFMNTDFIVLEDIAQLSFSKGSILTTDGVVNYDASKNAHACHYGYVVKVTGFETLYFDSTVVDGLSFSFGEFMGKSMEVNKNGSYFNSWNTSSVELDSDTDYIIITVKNSASTDFTSSQLALISSCFELA